MLTNDGTSPAYTVTSNDAWISAALGPAGVDVVVDSTGLAAGSYTGSVTAEAPGYLPGTLTVGLVVFSSGTYDILFSASANRSNASGLHNKNVVGDIYVFTSPDSGASSVTFYIDDPAGTGAPHRLEKSAPFDLFGGSAAAANPFDTTALGDGLHSITAVVALSAGGTETVIASFNVANGTPGLQFQPQELTIITDDEGLGSAQAAVETTDGSSTSYTLTESSPWLTVEQITPNSGLAVLFGVDATGLAPGTHSTTVTATAAGYLPASLVVTVVVSGSDTYDIVYSLDSSLASPVDLSGAVVAGDIWVHLLPETGVQRVRFYLDDPNRVGSPYRTENGAPYELVGGAAFDTTSLGDGFHTITTVVELSAGGQEIIHASFEVLNGAPILQFGSSVVLVPIEEGLTATSSTSLSTSNAAAASFTVTESADWLVVTPSVGTTPANLSLQVSAVDLTAGTYETTVTASAAGFGDASLLVRLSVQGESIYDLLVSTSSSRSNPFLLQGAETSDDIYVFTSPDTQVASVDFYLDNPSASGPPTHSEGNGPFDFSGGSATAASPFQTTSISDGPHSITAVLHLSGGGTEVITSSFLVLNNGPALSVSPSGLNFLVVSGSGAPSPQILGVSTNNGTIADYSIASSAPWLTATPTSGQTPATIEVNVDPTGLADGGHDATLVFSAAGYSNVTIPVVLTIGDDICAPLACSDLLIELPLTLTFDEDHGGVPAGTSPDEFGTGFTMILPSQFGEGYLPGRLSVDPGNGVLQVLSTEGSLSGNSNDQDNALGVGIDIPSQVTLIQTRMLDIPPMTENFEQFGLWFGTDDRNVLRLFVNSTPSGDRIRCLLEVNDNTSATSLDSPYFADLSGATVDLALRVNPVNREVNAFYAIDGGAFLPLGFLKPPPEFFSFDAAGIDPEIGTRSFAGVFASHRNAPAAQVYTFDDFSVSAEPLPPPQTEIAFDRVSFPQTVLFPTSMVVGPDGRLYVLEMQGKIHAFTLGANKLPIAHQQITSLQTFHGGPRLALGIAVGPNSGPGNVDLYVCHSGPDPDAGDINSGTITRLSGPNFATAEVVIEGLPRAFANHAPNSLHFGPDQRLYIAIGGNTGAGAPNTSGSEFGTRMEQYLSAALIAADIFAPTVTWPIDCFDDLVSDDPNFAPGIPPCAQGASPIVEVYSSGLRNVYDFAFHPNGSIYGPDNGLGVTGTYPPTPFDPCFGPASVSANNPGEQQDLLLRLEPNLYYGHPNPSRGECVYKDGSWQGVPPLPNYAPPMLNLGEHKSANGIIVYGSGTSFCGALQGDLLITNYSVGDDMVRVRLAADGMSALGAPTKIVGQLDDPLPIAQDASGTIFIGEFGADRVTAFIPKDTGCWSTADDMPLALLDVAGAAIDGLFYVVAGKTGSGPVSSLLIYDPTTGVWTSGPNRPGIPVENPAVVAHDGKLWVFGGSSQPFNGMVAEAHVFDPLLGPNGTWSALPPMPTPRGGATVQYLQGSFYVIGGLAEGGGSVGTVEVFDPITGVWATRPSLLTARDNPGSAVLNGKIFVFGGRLRNANGTTVNGTLASTEMYDPAVQGWTTRAPMPTGRRTFATVVLDGKALVMGGEATAGGGAFAQNEEYDEAFDTWRTLAPMLTPRHGCAAAVIDGHVYVAGGGIVAGSSFSDVLEVFSFSGN